ncbi:MAG: metal ABC transporter permease [Candidatus Caldarchaeum sp.]|nr:metal ABC transporter permease [Candidatus Caldarchaeales archaeon]
MIEALSQPFMQRAFGAAIVTGLLLPLIGNYLVPKRLSLVGDASSHAAFAVIALSSLLGFGATFLTYIAPVAAIYAILQLMRRFHVSGDQALATLLAVGGATASLAISLGARVNLNAILFGSIILVQLEDIIIGASVAAAVILFVAGNFGKTLVYTVSEELAKVRGVQVETYSLVFAVAAGLSIVTGIKIAGVLLVTALLAIPTMAASLISNSFKKSILLSMLFGATATTLGIFMSYFLDIAPGAASVMGLMIFLVFCLVLRSMRIRI